MSNTKVMIIAGEVSGDQHAAAMIRQALNINSNIDFYGIGGKQMRDAGATTFIDIKELSLFGILDVALKFFTILKLLKRVKQEIISTQPDLIVLVDYPGFNLKVAEIAKKQGAKVLYYISPKIWASRKGRIKKLEQYVDHMAVIFPFELDVYKSSHLKTTYVGNPLTEKVHATKTKAEFCQQHQLKPDAPIIGLLPGSRPSEIKRLMPVLNQTANLIRNKLPDVQFVLPLADSVKRNTIQSYLTTDVSIIENDAYNTINACDAVAICSGTATLETALLQTPMAVIYKVPWIAVALFWILIKTPYVSLCNIVAQKRIVNELLQSNCTPKKISSEIFKILENKPYHDNMVSELSAVRDQMFGATNQRSIGEVVIEMITLSTKHIKK